MAFERVKNVSILRVEKILLTGNGRWTSRTTLRFLLFSHRLLLCRPCHVVIIRLHTILATTLVYEFHILLLFKPMVFYYFTRSIILPARRFFRLLCCCGAIHSCNDKPLRRSGQQRPQTLYPTWQDRQ